MTSSSIIKRNWTPPFSAPNAGCVNPVTTPSTAVDAEVEGVVAVDRAMSRPPIHPDLSPATCSSHLSHIPSLQCHLKVWPRNMCVALVLRSPCNDLQSDGRC